MFFYYLFFFEVSLSIGDGSRFSKKKKKKNEANHLKYRETCDLNGPLLSDYINRTHLTDTTRFEFSFHRTACDRRTNRNGAHS